MNTSQINNLLKHYKNFIGVFPKDMLPEYKVGTLIANTDDSSMPGEHWIAMTLNSDKTGEYFDSFGLPPLHNEFIKYLNVHCPKGWIFNNATLQSLSAQTCGHYCVIYASLRCRGYKYKDVLSLFTNSKFVNDKIAERIVNAS